MVAVQKEAEQIHRRRPLTELQRAARSKAAKHQWGNTLGRDKKVKALQGHKVSVETREKLKNKFSGRVFSVESRDLMSREHGGIRLRAGELLQRGLVPSTVAAIVREPISHVEELIKRMRREGSLKTPTTDETRRAKSKGMVESIRLKKDPEFAKRKSDAIALAQKLYQAGFFSGNLQYWVKLNEIFQETDRELPAFDEEKLILEAFLTARLAFEAGDKAQFRKLGELFLNQEVAPQIKKDCYDIATVLRNRKVASFVEKFPNFLYTTAYWHSNSHQDAEDISQEALLKCLNVGIYIPADEEGMKLYITTVIKNIAIDKRRHLEIESRSRVRGAIRIISSTSSAEDQAMTILDLEIATRMAAMQQPPLVALYAMGFSTEEIAQASGKTRSSVKSSAHNQRVAIKNEVRIS